MIEEPSLESPNAPAKKGLSTGAKVGIGCGIVLLLALAVVGAAIVWAYSKTAAFVKEFEANPEKAGAELFVKFSPELELVSSDEASGEMTVKNTKTGETITASYADLAEGKLSVTTAEGKFSIDASGEGDGSLRITSPDGETVFNGGSDIVEKLPPWIAIHPEGARIKGGFAAEKDGELAGNVIYTTTRGAKEILDHYKGAMEAAGFHSASTTSFTVNSKETHSYSCKSSSPERSFTLQAKQETSGDTQVVITFQGTP